MSMLLMIWPKDYDGMVILKMMRTKQICKASFLAFYTALKPNKKGFTIIKYVRFSFTGLSTVFQKSDTVKHQELAYKTAYK